MYVVGAANVGKSAFVRTMLRVCGTEGFQGSTFRVGRAGGDSKDPAGLLDLMFWSESWLVRVPEAGPACCWSAAILR